MATGLDAALHAAPRRPGHSTGQRHQRGRDPGHVSGEFLGWMAFSLRAAAYEGIDAIARHFVGDPQQTVPLMNEIFTKQNL